MFPQVFVAFFILLIIYKWLSLFWRKLSRKLIIIFLYSEENLLFISYFLSEENFECSPRCLLLSLFWRKVWMSPRCSCWCSSTPVSSTSPTAGIWSRTTTPDSCCAILKQTGLTHLFSILTFFQYNLKSFTSVHQQFKSSYVVIPPFKIFTNFFFLFNYQHFLCTF